MHTFFIVVVYLIGGLFLLIGAAGMFTPENFASGLGLGLASAEGSGTVRAMIGAHYVAMGGVCLYAVVKEAACAAVANSSNRGCNDSCQRACCCKW